MPRARTPSRGSVAFAALLSCVLVPCVARATQRHRPYPRPNLQWFAAQLVPSVGERIDSSGAWFHLRWQLTPIALALGLRHGLVPVRTFIVEPGVRLRGMVEAFVDPEWTAQPTRAASQWGLRVGARTYVPFIQNGEYLAGSIGTSVLVQFDGTVSVGYEAGLYVLLGLFGIQTTFSPRTTNGPALWLTLSVRYF